MRKGTLENLAELDQELKEHAIPALLIGGMARFHNGIGQLPRKDIDVILMKETDLPLDGIDVGRMHKLRAVLRLPHEDSYGQTPKLWTYWKTANGTLFHWTFPNLDDIEWQAGLSIPDIVFLTRTELARTLESARHKDIFDRQILDHTHPKTIWAKIQRACTGPRQTSNLDALEIKAWSNYGHYCLTHDDYLEKYPC